MASTLSYSDFSSDNNTVENFAPKRRKNKTIKKKSSKVREFLNSMESEEETDTDKIIKYFSNNKFFNTQIPKFADKGLFF